MKHRSPKLTVVAAPLPLLALLLLAMLPVATGDAVSSLRAQAPSAGGDKQQRQTARAEAQEVIRRAIATLQQHRSVSAQLRQRVNLYGHQLIGTGQYLQGPPGSFQSRLELKLAVGQHEASWLQVCGGKYLWTYERTPDEEDEVKRKLSRVDVASVLRAMRKQQKQPSGQMGFQSFGIGGLAGVLDSVSRGFRFTSVEQGQLADFSVLIVRGYWEPAVLATLVPDVREAIKENPEVDVTRFTLPPHLPERASIYLGQDDLFPYRIVYDRIYPGESQPREVIQLELFEVAVDRTLGARHFQYNPGSTRFKKATKDYLKQRGLK